MSTVGDFHHDREEAEEVPEDFLELSPEKQEEAILKRAFAYLSLGTFVVVLFSDPMVDVLQEVANRMNVSPFYVSFLLAPLASNASEVIAWVDYARKSTRKTVTVFMTTLEGEASINNTFCLSILLGLIYFRGLVWAYTAEIIAIVLVQFIVGMLIPTKSKKFHKEINRNLIKIASGIHRDLVMMLPIADQGNLLGHWKR
jgi:Ca2+/Na+ antiporter